jgi:DNA-binding MarR family transcriptional regulator
MNREQAAREIMELFIRSVQKYNTLEKIGVKVGRMHELYHSERHMIDVIGDHPAMNITDLAKATGVTKGAVSQIAKKLEKKSVVLRRRSGTNGKEVHLELTKTGREFYVRHQETNKETIKPLIEELQKYPDGKVEFLVAMFGWIDEFLGLSGEKMKERR